MVSLDDLDKPIKAIGELLSLKSLHQTITTLYNVFAVETIGDLQYITDLNLLVRISMFLIFSPLS